MNHKPYAIRPGTDPALFDQFATMMADSDPWKTLGTVAFRGGGQGRQLLAYCEGHIIKTSPNIFICVSSFNTRALRLYQEVGFTFIGTLKDFLAPGFDELLLRKTIGPKLGYQK
jgi:muramoyltetrapeptide carboxypeptidase LdcA involved in peptidoglycan recycling